VTLGLGDADAEDADGEGDAELEASGAGGEHPLMTATTTAPTTSDDVVRVV
jgi:hypothetical protein